MKNEGEGMEADGEVAEEWMCVSLVAMLLWKDVGTGQTTHTHTNRDKRIYTHQEQGHAKLQLQLLLCSGKTSPWWDHMN